MKQRIFPYGTDAVNRYGIKVTAGAYAGAQWSSWDDGVPQLIAHDHQRLMGWSWPYALIFEPGRTWSLGQSLLAETDEDKTELKNRFYNHLARRVEDECRPHEGKLRRLMPDAGVEASLFYADAACLLREGLLGDVRPDLYASEDKDGLVVVNGLNHLGGGVFDVDGLAVFAHPFFRRSYSRYNTLNDAFFDTMDLLLAEGVEVRLALDRDLVGLAETYGRRSEFQFWWGPAFTDDLASIPTGVTRHGSTPREKLFSQIDHTDFFWYSRGGEHTLEVEEVRDSPSAAVGDRYGCRYVHSIVGEATGEVVHLDGAVRMYDDEGMVARLDVNLDAAPKQTEYTKLWRTDHPLPIALWKRVVNDYYRDNYLVGEYLGGGRGDLEGAEGVTEAHEPSAPSEADVEMDPVMRVTNERELTSLLVPYAMQPGDGVYVRIAMRPRPEPSGCDRWFRPFQFVPDPEHPEHLHSLMELGTLHLRKIIKRNGGVVGLPAQEMWVQYRDDYINLTPVVHEVEDPALVSHTLQAIRECADAHGLRHSRTVLSFTVAYPVGDREVSISAAGPVSDLVDWLDAVGFTVPQTQDEVADWAGRTAAHQSGRSCSDVDPLVLDTPSGLFIEREVVGEAFQARTWFDEAEERLRWSIAVDTKASAPPGAMVLQSALKSGAITVATSWILDDVVCTICSEDYLTCGCTVLDEGFSFNTNAARFFCHTWTDAQS
ncbi:MAG: hypothetical protein ABJF88_05370 [Rhodothermales bacterium]